MNMIHTRFEQTRWEFTNRKCEKIYFFSFVYWKRK